MHKNELIKYLKVLGNELEKINMQGEIILTGGAVMCLVHSARDMTKDIDALYEPKSEINRLAEQIAREYDLPRNWLNDGVKGFVSDNVEAEEFSQFGGLKISAVTPDYLLAMKLLSSRVEGQDYGDIKFLFKALNIKTCEQAELIVERFFPVNAILPKTKYVIEQCLEELQEEITIKVKETAQKYTYADYIKWDDDNRCELIDGVIYTMTPAPTWEHQSVSGELYKQLAIFLTGKKCKVFSAPFDVRLNADSGDDNVVQPDVVVVCDRSKLAGTGYNGVPDMIIEILSPSTSRKDKILKFNKYLQAGVREYWIVDPDYKIVSVYVLKNGKYVTAAYSDTDIIPVQVLEGCVIDMKEVFAYSL